MASTRRVEPVSDLDELLAIDTEIARLSARRLELLHALGVPTADAGLPLGDMRTASPEDQLTFLGWAHAYGGATTLDQGIGAYYPKDTPTWAVVVAKDIR